MTAVGCAQACSDAATFNIEASVAEFLGNASVDILELPENLSAAQRKQARKVAEQQPELKCESFGFGAERRLHIFKQTGKASVAAAGSAVVVKNTFIDDWIACENVGDDSVEALAFRSLPARELLKSSAGALNSQFALQRLDLSLVQDDCSQGHSDKLRLLSPALSTCASSCALGSPRAMRACVESPRSPSMISQARSNTPVCMRTSERVLNVRNTFIHIDEPSDSDADPRIVQSMPRDMFKQCLSMEITAASAADVHPREADAKPVAKACDVSPPMLATPSPTKNRSPGAWSNCFLAPGAGVTIDGLVLAPKFNGLSGIVQSYDSESGRYDVSITLHPGDGSRQLAKIKAQHLRLCSPSAQAAIRSLPAQVGGCAR